jgi:hypothetical protein
MAQFRYYLSRDPGTQSPPTDELKSVDADSQADALQRIRDSEGGPMDWPSVWVHFLVWAGADGEQRGFESTRLR